MMRKRIAFTLIIIGALTVFTSEFTYTPEFYSPDEIGENELNRRIRTNITVKDVMRKGSITLIKPERSGPDIVSFKKVPESIEKGGRLSIIGRVGKYRGTLQIVVDELVVR